MITPANLIADCGYPLLSETVKIGADMPLGTVVALDPATRVAALVDSTNKTNLFGVLRDNVAADQLGVVYVSGAFIADTLKIGTGVTREEIFGSLRPLGIYPRPSINYP
jgi:hypothetical protein